MPTLVTSSAAAQQVPMAYLTSEKINRSRQALEAVDAYLQWGDTCLAPRPVSFRLLTFLNNLAAKLLA